MLKGIYQFHYRQYRRVMDRFVIDKIFYNASKLSFKPLDFPRAIITTQIDSSTKAVIMTEVNFSSMEHERSYIDDDSNRLPFQSVSRYLESTDSLTKAREVKNFPNISCTSFSVSSK